MGQDQVSLSFGRLGGLLREKRRREEKRKKKRISGMDFYGFVWICEHLYGLLWFCMDLYGMDSWILDLVLCLGFCYEKF